MLTFTPRPEEPEEEPGIVWLRETLDRLAPDSGMPPGTTWSIQPGVREAGSDRGPRLRQSGYQILALNAEGVAYSPSCFVNATDSQEEELRPAVAQVLSLWLDRLSVQGSG